MPVTQKRGYDPAGTPGPAAAESVSYGAMKPMRTPPSDLADAGAERPEILPILLDNHARFLAFLERRVGSRDVAEDILQETQGRALGRLAGEAETVDARSMPRRSAGWSWTEGDSPS
jgi:hypothetical protein